MPNVPLASEAEWHAIRELHVGGSEIACLFYVWRLSNGSEVIRHLYEEPPEGALPVGCLSPHKSGFRLWQEKSGNLKPDDFSENERVLAGQFLEPALASWAQQKWDWKLRKVRRYVQHPQISGWGASLDYEAVQPGMPPVQFKNVDYLVFRDQWVEDGGEIVVPPMHVNLQLQHEIGAAEADHGWIVACVAGNELYRGRIERHDATQLRIGEAVAAFWLGVRENRVPEHVADLDTVAKMNARAEDKAIDLRGNDRLPVVCARLDRYRKHLKFVEKMVNMMEGRVALALGDATKAQLDGWRLSWPSYTRPAAMIPAKWQDELTYRMRLYVTKEKPPKPPKPTKERKAK